MGILCWSLREPGRTSLPPRMLFTVSATHSWIGKIWIRCVSVRSPSIVSLPFPAPPKILVVQNSPILTTKQKKPHRRHFTKTIHVLPRSVTTIQSSCCRKIPIQLIDRHGVAGFATAQSNCLNSCTQNISSKNATYQAHQTLDNIPRKQLYGSPSTQSVSQGTDTSHTRKSAPSSDA